MSLIDSLNNFLKFVSSWFNQFVASSAVDFIKALLNLFLGVLGFIIDILRWLLSKI